MGPGNPRFREALFSDSDIMLARFCLHLTKKVCKLSFGLTTWALFYVCTKKEKVDKKYVDDIMLAYFFVSKLHMCVYVFLLACLLEPPLTVKLK